MCPGAFFFDVRWGLAMRKARHSWEGQRLADPGLRCKLPRVHLPPLPTSRPLSSSRSASLSTPSESGLGLGAVLSSYSMCLRDLAEGCV